MAQVVRRWLAFRQIQRSFDVHDDDALISASLVKQAPVLTWPNFLRNVIYHSRKGYVAYQLEILQLQLEQAGSLCLSLNATNSLRLIVKRCLAVTASALKDVIVYRRSSRTSLLFLLLFLLLRLLRLLLLPSLLLYLM